MTNFKFYTNIKDNLSTQKLRVIWHFMLVMTLVVFTWQSTLATSPNVKLDVDRINAAIKANNIKNLYKNMVVGGDFSIDFVAAAPYTYDHRTGGGSFDDRTIGKDKDVVESLEGGDFKCRDIVTFLTQIKVASTAAGSQTIELDYSFLAHSTGQQGVALYPISAAMLNSGIIDPYPGSTQVGDGVDGKDAGMIEKTIANTPTVVTLTTPVDKLTTGGSVFSKPTRTLATVRVSGLEAGETIIVRVDVIIACQIPSSPTGNLQADITAGRVIIPDNLSKKNATISLGKQTIPFKNVNLIAQGTCALDNDYIEVCEGDVKTYNLTTNGTPTWSLTGDGIFTNSSGDPLDAIDPAAGNPGVATTVYVKATKPTGLKGSYTLTVDVNSEVDPIQCSDQVDVYATPDKPFVVITEGVNSLCATPTKPSLQVCNPIEGLTYFLDYGSKNLSGDYTKNSTVKNNSTDNLNYPNVIFTDLDPGEGFRIKAINPNTATGSTFSCSSAYTTCDDDEVVENCPDPNARIQGASSSSPIKKISEIKGQDLIAYPVPFSKKATVEFKLEKSEMYQINLYDMKGNLIKQLKSGTAKAGELQQIEVDGANLAEGIYLVRVVSSQGAKTIKLLKKE
jgi:hypothetical protein